VKARTLLELDIHIESRSVWPTKLFIVIENYEMPSTAFSY